MINEKLILRSDIMFIRLKVANNRTFELWVHKRILKLNTFYGLEPVQRFAYLLNFWNCASEILFWCIGHEEGMFSDWKSAFLILNSWFLVTLWALSELLATFKVFLSTLRHTLHYFLHSAHSHLEFLFNWIEGLSLDFIMMSGTGAVGLCLWL